MYTVIIDGTTISTKDYEEAVMIYSKHYKTAKSLEIRDQENKILVKKAGN